jgi:hypothetical protein
MLKRPNLRIHGEKEGNEIQTKGIRALFNEIMAENFPNLCNDIDTHVKEYFKLQIDISEKNNHTTHHN